MEKVVVQHALTWRDHHFEDALGGSGAPVRPQFRRERTDLKSDAVATRNPTPQVTEGICSEPHETAEPAATKRAAAGSSGIGVPRQEAAQKKPAGAMGPTAGLPGWRPGLAQKTARPGQDGRAGVKKVAGTGFDTPGD